MFTLHCYPNQISTVHSMVLSGWLRKVGGVGGRGGKVRAGGRGRKEEGVGRWNRRAMQGVVAKVKGAGGMRKA